MYMRCVELYDDALCCASLSHRSLSINLCISPLCRCLFFHLSVCLRGYVSLTEEVYR